VAAKNDPRDDASPNTAQLRASIPSGRTVSIDSAHEPSAAPFDTDDEAAGRPAQRAAIEQALAHEGRLPAQAAPAAGVRASRSGAHAGRPGAPALWITVAVILAAVVAFVVVS
jgi:hypothetical protein